MKIGILTLPLHTNYGGNLQAFALMRTLRDLGHQPVLINRKKNRLPELKYPLKILKRTLEKKFLGKSNIDIYREMRSRIEQEALGLYTRKFIDKHIQPQTEEFESSKELTEGIGKYNFDAIIVGSDQVWRPRYTPTIQDYFLSFCMGTSTKRISYAASFGTDDWTFTEQQTNSCAKLLQSFDHIAVRESSAVSLCKDKFGVEPTHVIDPTMLLNPEVYINTLDEISVSNRGKGLLVYILDESEEARAVIDKISKSRRLDSFRVNSKTENKEASLADRVAPPTEQWLKGFYEADFVIADSFHACAFSILFNKPFIAYGNKSRGLTRFESLLKMFKLEDRLITNFDMLNDQLIESDINWVEVNTLLSDQRKKAKDFLEVALAAR